MAARLNYKRFWGSSFHSYKQKKPHKIDGLQNSGTYNMVILKGLSIVPKPSLLSLVHEGRGRLNFGVDMLSSYIQSSQCLQYEQQTSRLGVLRMNRT